MPIKINLKTVALYCAYAILLFGLSRAVQFVPFGLGLCFALLACGGNIIITPIIYVLVSIINLNLIYSLLSLFEGCFLSTIVLIYRKTHKKIKFEGVAYLCVALAPFVCFSPWQWYDLGGFLSNTYLIKSIAAILVIIFSYACFTSVYALMYRICRCALKAEELICFTIVFTLFGAGVYNLLGLYTYLCLCICCTIFAVRLFKSPTAVIISIISIVPCALCTLSLEYIAAIAILGILTLIFCNVGKGAPSAVALILCAAYLYFGGYFSSSPGTTTVRALLLACCCILPIIPSDSKLKNYLNLLTVKTVLPDTIEERIKTITSEKLFKLSEVFREIECAFNNMDEGIDEGALKERMLGDLEDKCCTSCEMREKHSCTSVYIGFKKLIDCGSLKGKVSLVDLPKEVTSGCFHPADVIQHLNKLLADYRRYMLEAENAQSGRALLANQAKGIADVLKNCAVEFSKPCGDHEETCTRISSALTSIGISCPEIKMTGEYNHELYLTVVGKVNISKIRAVIKDCTGLNFILKDKVVYDADKSCLIFTNPPLYDAAFGVAYAIKEGEKFSGDTHTVIKINEHCFLMALSDGMGSGEYAQKVSSTAISLIEAFYRAEMPTGIVLDTINKLICFNRDERFACIDVAAIDLNTLTAGFIKIGSPAGIIVRSGEIKVLESDSLPLGILDSLHPTVCNEHLKNGDIVVFMSDGITSAFSSSGELYEFLEKLKPLNPQSLAEKILSDALKKSGGPKDDMTVLCTRIFKRNEE
jgi:stage II sporulation protein E